MERRRYARQSSSINAVLRDLGGSLHDCLIRDFSQSGIFVIFDSPLPQRDLDMLQIPGSAAGWPGIRITPSNGQSLLQAVEIVHLSPQTCGLKFIRQDPQYFAALQQLAIQTEQQLQPAFVHAAQTQQSTLSYAAKGNLIRATNRETRLFLEENLEPCFNELGKALLHAAEQSLSAEQNILMDAMHLLRKEQAQLTRQLIEQLSSDALDVSRGEHPLPVEAASPDQQKQMLALVEKEDFENWLMVKVTISKADQQLRESLIELQLRLDAAFANRGAPRSYNPYSPAAITNTLYELVQPLQLNYKTIKLLCENLHTHLLTHLDVLYQTLHQLFIDANILPNIDAFTSLRRQSTQQHRNTLAANSDTETDASAEQPAQPAPEPQAPIAAPTLPHSTASHAPAEHEHIHAPNLVPSQRDALGTATRLHALQRQADPSPLPLTTYQPDSEAFKALSRLQKRLLSQPADDTPLRQQLLRASDNQHELTEHEQDSADMVEGLFACIAENERVQDDLRSDLRKLQVPILGLMLKDPELFSSDFHPARQTINYLALLADKESHSVEHNKPAIRAAIHAILASEDDDAGFTQALATLDQLVSREKRLIERNIALLRESHEGQQRLRHANDAIEQALAERLIAPVHQPIIELLEYGWKELLRLSYLRDGINSQPWEMALKVIERLIQRTTTGQPQEPSVQHANQNLIRLIDNGLSRVSDQHGQHAALKKRLSCLLHSPDDSTEPLVSYQPLTSDSELLQSRIDSLAETDRSMQRWIKRAANLHLSQWFELTHDDLQAQLSQLIWISADGYRLIFANHQATRGCELALDQVAQLLRDEQLVLLSDAALPAVEQGLDALVQKVYDKLAFDSSHDQLTGLYTRKEFCRLLTLSAAHAREHGSIYTLIFIDILQFKIINNTCGYEAGDRLLRDVALRIKGILPDDAHAGRMGPDQFALLLPVEAATQGFRQANELKQAIEDHRFVHEDQSFVINVVLSLIGFDQNTPRIMELLRRVEVASGLSKKAGHKDIQLVHSDDQRLEELDEVMNWVSRINRALDTDNLEIRCQHITPTPINSSDQVHFEILLTVIDDQGEHILPAEFIKVAEEYNRMGAVDRWVIKTVLAWMHDHKSLLDCFGGFSINLSGHSMNDDTFLDFLFEALVQYQVPRNKLIFEITETTAVANLEDAADFIDEMRNIGCRFSLDDFGVGQSSYAYLKRLPVDFIKIDGAFVRDINDNDVDYALVRSITEMGHYLGKKVIAEYVSSEAIHTVINDIGVDYAQGHLFGLPIMLDQLADNLPA